MQVATGGSGITALPGQVTDIPSPGGQSGDLCQVTADADSHPCGKGAEQGCSQRQFRRAGGCDRREPDERNGADHGALRFGHGRPATLLFLDNRKRRREDGRCGQHDATGTLPSDDPDQPGQDEIAAP